MSGEREKFGNIQLWNIQMSGKCFSTVFEMQNIEGHSVKSPTRLLQQL